MSIDKKTISVSSEGVALFDVVGFCKEGWRWLSGGLMVGVVSAVVFVLITPAQYEATAIISPATVGIPTAGVTAATIKGTEVEPVVQMLERLKLPTFYPESLLQVCGANSRQGLARSVNSRQVKNNSLIQLSFRAPSAAVAESCVNAIMAHLASSQVAIGEPLVKALEEQLALTRKQLVEAEAFQHNLDKRVAALQDGPSVMMLSALSKRGEILRLQKNLNEQALWLSAPLTQPMQLLEAIYAPESPVFPNKLSALAGGVFGGLILGGLGFFMRRSWLKRLAV